MAELIEIGEQQERVILFAASTNACLPPTRSAPTWKPAAGNSLCRLSPSRMRKSMATR